MIRRHNMPPLDGKDREVVLTYLEAAYPPRAPAGGRGWQNPFSKQMSTSRYARARRSFGSRAPRSSRCASASRRGTRLAGRRRCGAARRARTASQASARCRRDTRLSRSSAQAIMPRSTSSIPALQNQPLISKRGSSILAREAQAAARRRRGRNGSTRTAPNFVSMVFGDVRGADRRSSGMLAVMSSAPRRRRRTIDLDHGGRAARLAEGEDVLASAAAGVTPDRVARLQRRTPGWSSQRPGTAC